MISLNKSGYIRTDSTIDYLSSHFRGYYSYILSNAGDGLNYSYQKLYEERGSLRIGVSPFACVLAIYPIVLNGHTPVFIDIDEDTFNIDAQKLIATNDIDAVEVIHLGGNPCEMDVICQWAHDNGIIIIEDCAQALGSFYDGVELGNFGDYATFSLIKNLHETTGGLFLSKYKIKSDNFQEISSYVIAYRELKRFLECHTNHHSYNPWNMLYHSVLQLKEKKSHSLMTNIHRLSNKRTTYLKNRLYTIEEINNRRVENVNEITRGIDPSKYCVQKVLPKGVTNRNRFFLKLLSGDAQTMINKLRENGIAANNLTQSYLHGFQPHVRFDNLLSDYYQKEKLECYDSIFNSVIAIPSSPFLSKSEKAYIINTLNSL